MSENLVKKKIDEQRQIDDDSALRHILNSKQGRRWMWKHLGDCGLSLNSFAGEQPITMAFNTGRQSVAQSLLADINRVQPDAFTLMIHESQFKEELYDRSSSDGSTSNGGTDHDDDPNNYDPLGSILAD